jgi:hypothetical protein
VILTDPTGRFDLYCLRHAFKTAMNRVVVEPEIRKRLMGHALSIHEGYGGTDLVLLRDYVSRLQIVDRQPILEAA